MKKTRVRGAIALATCLLATSAWAQKVTIAHIDGLSGPFAAAGESGSSEIQFAVSKFLQGKEVGGKKLEVEVVSLDGQVNPTESLVQLRNAISRGASYVIQGNGSSVTHALVDAIAKHNKRSPDQRLVLLNYGAIDPALTNQNCSFWHFSFDANLNSKMKAVGEFLTTDQDAKKVKKAFIISQDYSFGKAFATTMRKTINDTRPDMEIVGDEVHPIGKVKDFTPYAQKIKSSGAGAIFTANWGPDMTNLVKALDDLGVDAKLYSLYGYGMGITSTIGKSGEDRLYVLSLSWRMNPPPTPEFVQYTDAYKEKYRGADHLAPHITDMIRMLGAAMEKAGSTDPTKVATAFEGLEMTTLAGDRVVMRKDDHQLLMPIQITAHTNKGIKYDFDKSGYGLLTTASIPIERNETATACKMDRP